MKDQKYFELLFEKSFFNLEGGLPYPEIDMLFYVFTRGLVCVLCMYVCVQALFCHLVTKFPLKKWNILREKEKIV